MSSFLDNKNEPTNLDKDGVIFTIKNLDENKIRFIDKEDKVDEILIGIDELPEL